MLLTAPQGRSAPPAPPQQLPACLDLHSLPAGSVRPRRCASHHPQGQVRRVHCTVHCQAQRRDVPAAQGGRSPVEEDGSNQPSTPQNPEQSFGELEQRLASSFNAQQPGLRGDWVEIEGSWVLRPPTRAAPARAVIHFLGGAFLGAAPQLTYRLFLENLAAQGYLVVATPFSTGFDHLRLADEAQFRFNIAMRALRAEAGRLPIIGVGHSLGSLLHLLINARYGAERAGNVLLSFNNKPATDSIPFLSPFIAPGARALAPLLSQLATSPFRTQLEQVSDALSGVSPDLMRQVGPLLSQLSPIYMDVAQGKAEFTPVPAETRKLIRSYYGVPKNLLVRFMNDSLDETPELDQMMQQAAGPSRLVDVSVRTLPGDHARPCRQAFGDFPPDVARFADGAAASGGLLFSTLSDFATQAGLREASMQLGDLSRNVSGLQGMFGGAQGPGALGDDMAQLAREVSAWIDAEAMPPRALPPSASADVTASGSL